MKKNVKGFTLIELIVVIAIFSIIMAAATSLITPVSKTIVLADVRDEGSALVTNISDYIEGQLSTAEYLSIKNDAYEDSSGNTDEAAIKNSVKAFMDSHYKGLLRAGCTATSPQYASGTVHVMVIDNEMDNGAGYAKGRIKHYTYSADFGNINGTLKQETKDEWAVNKVYYNKSKEVQVKFGDYANKAEFDAADTLGEMATLAALKENFSSKNTNFTISVTSERKVGISDTREYSFIEHASVSMINIYNRLISQKGIPYPIGTYYFIKQMDKIKADGTGYEVDASGNHVKEPVITDLRNTDDHAKSAILTDASGSNNGYCIIYSYTNEIDTKKS